MRAKPSVLIAIIFIILLLGVLPMCSNPLIEKLIEGDQKENNPEITTLSGVSLNPTTLTLLVSETETLTATVHINTPRKAVTWTSCTPSVATVSGNGIVTALAAGTATITVATVDGNHWASCTVTVRESTGEADAPFLIWNEIQLRQVGIADGWNLSAHYKLTADITLNGEWTPIDDGNTGWMGGFDGNNKTITGLSINKPNEGWLGMFGFIGRDGKVKNLRLDNCNVHGDTNVGGIVGQNAGTVQNCYVSVVIKGTSNIGGVAGANQGTVQNCYVSGVVKGENAQIGGVTGANYNTVENCYFTGTVSGTVSQIGGVVGRNEKGTITNCNAEGDVSGTNNTGGVVGYNNAGVIGNCYATGTVIGTGNTVGGVVGNNYGGTATVINCYATGNVNGNIHVGGVAGYSSGTVENSHATGDVSGNNPTGGVVGASSGIVRNCYATGDVSGTDIMVGGVVGSNTGLLTYCYATGDVSGTNNMVGGVAGENADIIENCYATGNVSGTGNYVGGVAGQSQTGSVINCYATGNVSGTGNYVGGVVGYSQRAVRNCYATGNVEGNSSVGGVVGSSSGSGTVENCVALNPNINSISTSLFGRVSSGTNNYARRDMKLNNSAAQWFNSTNGKDGADITPANYQLQSWWSSRAGFDFSATGVWEWHTANKLPILKGMGTQNPKVSAFNTLETTFVVSGTAFEMVWINAGTFLMGSPTSELNRSADETLHEVTLTKGFYIGKYEVTQAQWEMVMGTTITSQQALATLQSTDNYGQGDNYPMYYVSWYEAIVFCNKLSMLEGLDPAYSIWGYTDPARWGDVPTSSDATWNDVKIEYYSNGYRLPTEAQWEYSCRAGSTEGFNWGTDYINSTQANYNYQLRGTSVVGSYAPNAWGLYDMHGNVAEMCWDWSSSYDAGVAVTDPTGPSSGNYRTYRGGSFYDIGGQLRSAYRHTLSPQNRSNDRGFRIVRPF